MIRIDIKRSKFYSELTELDASTYFTQTRCKFIPMVDNIYYSVSILWDTDGNPELISLLENLEYKKALAIQNRAPVLFHITSDLEVNTMGFNIYKYCLTRRDLYDIFILDYLPNEETPRIMVQIRSYGIWLHGYDKMLKESYADVCLLLQDMLTGSKCCISHVQENRIDYCYHTNIISSPDKQFSDSRVQSQMQTTMRKWQQMGRIKKSKNESERVKLGKDYFAVGDRKSNNLYVRFYNKAVEVIEMAYKGYFFQIWYESGLINFYDVYCFDYAIKHHNYDYIHKAKLEFYIEYGKDEALANMFSDVLRKKSSTLDDFKKLADEYMPKTTVVLNIEFETKRKFYYHSDAFIDSLGVNESHKVHDGPLRRIYKILDNRNIFLEYLTRETICFKDDDNKYCDWWQRLRDVNHGECNNLDTELVRVYGQELDEELMRKKFVNIVASNAVYSDNLDTNFASDVVNLLCNINDNDKAEFLVLTLSEHGEIEDFKSKHLKYYRETKAKKEAQIKNRKKKVGKIDKKVEETDKNPDTNITHK